MGCVIVGVVNPTFVETQRAAFFGTHLGSVYTVVKVRFEEDF